MMTLIRAINFVNECLNSIQFSFITKVGHLAISLWIFRYAVGMSMSKEREEERKKNKNLEKRRKEYIT